jgi:hypothetical protein
VIAGNVNDFRFELTHELDEAAVILEILAPAFILNDVTQVDDEIGLLDSIHAIDEATRKRRRLMRHLTKLTVVVCERSEVDVGDQRKAHDEMTLSSSVRSGELPT